MKTPRRVTIQKPKRLRNLNRVSHELELVKNTSRWSVGLLDESHYTPISISRMQRRLYASPETRGIRKNVSDLVPRYIGDQNFDTKKTDLQTFFQVGFDGGGGNRRFGEGWFVLVANATNPQQTRRLATT